MGEAFISRRGNEHKGYEIILGKIIGDAWGGYIEDLDFDKYDYILNVASNGSSGIGSNSDTYIIKKGVVTEEYHSDQWKVYCKVNVYPKTNKIEIIEQYSNVGLMTNGSILIQLN